MGARGEEGGGRILHFSVNNQKGFSVNWALGASGGFSLGERGCREWKGLGRRGGIEKFSAV